MTTSKKLWLGFGMLTALLVVVCGAILVRVHSIEVHIKELAEVARHRSTLARELEINALHYALNVRTYLHIGEPEARMAADNAADTVERLLVEYVDYARTDEQRRLAADCAEKWRRLTAQGKVLLNAMNRQPAEDDLVTFYDLRRDLSQVVNDEMQKDAFAREKARTDGTLQDVRSILEFALILLLVGVVIAVLTSGMVGSAVVRGEQVIAEQRERLRTTLASIGDAVIATDTEGRITNMNAVAESLTGWETAEALGQPLSTVFRIVNERTRKSVENPVEKVLTLGRAVGLANHTVLIARQGTERPIDDSAAPIRCKEGKIVGCVLVFRDVADRRRQEAALQRYADQLRDERELLQVTLASIGDAVLTTDSEGRITSMNAVGESLTGWAQAEAVGQPLDAVFSIVNEETRHRVENPATRALREGVIVGLANHTILIRKDGTERPIDDSAAPIRDARGHILGCVLVFRDITERRRLEKESAARLEAARFLASIVESSRDGIYSKSLDSIIQSWNAAAERLLGYTAEQAVGQHNSMIIPADRAGEEEQIVNRIRAGEKVDHFETVRLRKDGQPIHVSLTISPIRDEAGQVVGVSKIVRDITDRKQTEERIYGLLAELKEADRRKDEFLAMLAHELRSPLAPLSNMLEIMKRVDGNGDLLRQARCTMERQLGQLVRLVDDLIDVSRITRNKIELRKQRVDLASILHQSVEACRPVAESASLELSVTIPPQPIYLHADPVRLAQVFSNILNNACKYTEPGGKIWLTAQRQGSEVVVRVKDTGLGIPPEKLGSVFEMFTQIDRTLERSQGGLGIGLTLAKRLVEMHDGTITAHSEGPGKGSEFAVRFPILIEAPKQDEPGPEAVATTLPCRILVVDDNPDAASSLAMLLKIIGNETQIAHDGMEAVQAAEKFRPDLILLDIGLPKLNGYDACRRIRAQPWGGDMLIVALTGWGQDDDRRKSKDAGFDHHMVKPVDFAVLTKLLSENQRTRQHSAS